MKEGIPQYQTRIREKRLEVDSVDEHIIELLGKRMEIAKKMGELNISTAGLALY